MKNSWFSQLIHTLRLGLGEDSTVVASAPAVPVRDIFRRFWPYARPYRGAFAFTLVFVVLVPAVEALTIWMYKVLVDDVLIPGNFDLLLWVVLAYLALTLLEGFVSFGDDYLGAWVGEHFVMSLRTSFFRHLQGLSLHFFDSKQLGDVLTRLTKDVGAVEGLVLSGVAAALSYGAQLIIYTGVLFYLQWKLALVSLIVTPLFWFLARYFSGRIKRVAREERRRSGSVSAVAEESLANAMLVQAYNRQDTEVGRFHRESEGSFRAHLAATRLEALFSPLVNLTEVAGVLTVILVGSYELAQGRFTIGGLLVFLVYLGQLYGPIRGFSSLLNRVHSASAGAERILEFLDEKPAVQEKPDARTLARARGILSFESVTFRYPGAPRDALHDLSFSIGPGETLALVGASGAGKSTLAKLLVRFGDPGAGRICLDGYDLRELKLHSLRENVTLLLQETLVFDGTVRDNLLYGKPDASESEILSAAKAADAHDFIVALPEGYDTVIGQRGRLLSGGQRQRLAIARAMIRDAPVLVLDEPTTGLDAASSRRVLEPLRRLMAGRTVLIISHNLLTVQDATRILVLEGGRVAETGDHATLLANEGVYAHYYRLHGTHHDRYDTPTA